MDVILCDRCERKIEGNSGLQLNAGGGTLGMGGTKLMLCVECRVEFKRFMKGK